MKFPSWAQVVWWLLLLGGLTALNVSRYPDLAAGRGTALDAFALVIWVVLWLLPLFQEIGLFGMVTLKARVDEVKREVQADIDRLRSDIRNAVDVRTQFNPQITFATPCRFSTACA